MSTLAQIRTKVKKLARDGALILTDPDDYDLCLSRALQTYSLLRPRPLAQDLTIDSNHQVAVSSITNFDRAYIEKMVIEYPVLQTYGAPNYLERAAWSLYQALSGLVIRFNLAPNIGETLRITHAVPHGIPLDGDGNPDGDGDLTVIESDTDAVAAEAAANACEMLSLYYTQTADKSQGADFVGFTTKGQEYKKRADMLHGFFSTHMEKSLGMGRGGFQVVRA